MTLPQPLLRPVNLPAGGSIPGAIAASSRLNVHGTVKPTLTAIGSSPLRPGTISFRIGGREAALASRLGCREDDVVAASTPYVGDPRDRVAKWGDGLIFRRDVETRIRRLAPFTLAKDGFHRAAWTVRLLDYCPQSLERLVEACPRCGLRLGWLAAWGVGHCDDRRCGETHGPIPPSGEKLPGGLTDGYRLFADLVSTIPADRAAAMRRLSRELHALDPAALTDLALKLGSALERIEKVGIDRLRSVSAIERATCLAVGASLLLDWPNALRSAVRGRIASDVGTSKEYRLSLQEALLAASRPPRGKAATEALMRAALPEIFVDSGQAFNGVERKLVRSGEAVKRLGSCHRRFHAAVAAGVFTREAVREGAYTCGLYVQSEVDAAEAAWRGSSAIELAMRRLGLPRYACERLTAIGLLAREDDPWAQTLEGQPRVTTASLESLVRRLATMRSNAVAPADATTLRLAMRSVGGRLKPWAQVVDAMRRGRLPFWADAALSSVDAVRVVPAQLSRFARLDAEHGVPSAAFLSEEMVLTDALEVLNLQSKKGVALVAEGRLPTRAGAKNRILIPMRDVLAVAAAHVSTSEIAGRLRVNPVAAHFAAELVLGEAPSVAGWRRTEAEAAFAVIEAEAGAPRRRRRRIG